MGIAMGRDGGDFFVRGRLFAAGPRRLPLKARQELIDLRKLIAQGGGLAQEANDSSPQLLLLPFALANMALDAVQFARPGLYLLAHSAALSGHKIRRAALSGYFLPKPFQPGFNAGDFRFRLPDSGSILLGQPGLIVDPLLRPLRFPSRGGASFPALLQLGFEVKAFFLRGSELGLQPLDPGVAASKLFSRQ